MSNRGGRSHKHGLVGLKPPKSSLFKRSNKQKASDRKAAAVMEWQKLTAGV